MTAETPSPRPALRIHGFVCTRIRTNSSICSCPVLWALFIGNLALKPHSGAFNLPPASILKLEEYSLDGGRCSSSFRTSFSDFCPGTKFASLSLTDGMRRPVPDGMRYAPKVESSHSRSGASAWWRCCDSVGRGSAHRWRTTASPRRSRSWRSCTGPRSRALWFPHHPNPGGVRLRQCLRRSQQIRPLLPRKANNADPSPTTDRV